MKDLMIDIETLGTAVNAPVLSIGACYFDRNTGEIGDKFHGKIDAEESLKHGRMSGATFKWWMNQSHDARQKVTAGTLTSELVFSKFHDFALKHGADVRPWGNGATFDISILEYAFGRILSKPAPWKFYNVRDCRTIKELAGEEGITFTGELSGTAHSALDDAVFQAQWVSFYWQGLTGSQHTSPPLDDDLLGGA